MANEIDLSWFDLSKYDELASMDLSGWRILIYARNIVFNSIETDEFNDCHSIFEKIKEHPLWCAKNKDLTDLRFNPLTEIRAFPFNTYSVFSRPPLYSCFDDDLCKTYIPQDFITGEAKSELGKIEDSHNANIIIDLTATDEQITNDFKHWLSEYRKYTGYYSNKNNFTNKDLTYWHELSLLPYIDLMIYAAIEGEKITDSAVSELINQDVDRLRKTIKSKAAQLLRNETLATIEAQLSSFPKK